jgi:hypothetical protein
MTLKFSIQPQEMGNWCWLAVAASVGDFFARQRQCKLAQALVSQLPAGTQCCDNPTPSACDQPWYLSTALSHLNHDNGSDPNLALFSKIENEIASGNPVAMVLVYTGSGLPHVVAVSDAYSTQGNQFLQIEDPDPAVGKPNVIPYGVTTYNNASILWHRTYFTKP